MIITVTPTREIFDNALRAAREIGQPTGLDQGLNADLLANLRGRLEQAWSEVEKTLNNAFVFGRQRVQETIDASIKKINELLGAAGEYARELQALLLQRTREFLRNFIEGVLASLPGTLNAGGIPLTLASLQLTHRLKLSGSVEANLTSLASLVSEGEIEIASEYKNAPPPAVAG